MPGKKLARIDLEPARGLSVLFVFGFHLLGVTIGMQNLPWDGLTRSLHFDLGWSLLPLTPFTLGWHGVAVFFGISGYCIQLSWLQGDRSWWSFGVRRFYRLFPTYLFWLLVFIFLASFLPKVFTFSCDKTQIVSHVLLIHNWSWRTLWGINPSFWSIAVEIQLYALLPILVGIAHKWGWGRALAITAVIEIVFRFPWKWLFDIEINDYLLGAHVLGITFAYWFSWSIGAWVASRQYAGASQPLAKVPLTVAVSLVIICWYFKPLSDFSFAAASIATCVWISKELVLAEKQERKPVGTSPKSKNLWYRILALMGACSYSLYLLHQPLLAAFNASCIRDLDLHPATKMMINLGVLLPILTLIAYCSFRLIEMPTALWGRKRKT
jgi:peptidoglycan/LPS O-acetylase OafA/YrhL